MTGRRRSCLAHWAPLNNLRPAEATASFPKGSGHRARHEPEENAELIGVLALAANLASVLLLLRYKEGDANVRSVWLCSRNDAIGNVVVTLHEILTLGQFFVFSAGNSETRTDSRECTTRV